MELRLAVFLLLVLALPAIFYGQTKPEDISLSQLQSVISLPLSQAVKQREVYKEPLKAAYERQIAMTEKDCEAESKQGQQPYNICMGKASEQADNDSAIFYNNLQMLCHDQDQLTTLQASEKVWMSYRDSVMKATHASWPDGSGASGFTSLVYLSLVRDHMSELDEIYGLNIGQ